MQVKFFNMFVVPADKEEEFLIAWNYTLYLNANMPGFVETHLFKNTGAGGNTFQYINFVSWESGDTLRSAHNAVDATKSGAKPSELTMPGVAFNHGAFRRLFTVKDWHTTN